MKLDINDYFLSKVSICVIFFKLEYSVDKNSKQTKLEKKPEEPIPEKDVQRARSPRSIKGLITYWYQRSFISRV